MEQMKKVWFVTGASKGLGLVLVKRLLREGHAVAATSRDLPSLVKAVGEGSEAFLPLEMDLVNEKSVASAVEKTLRHFSTIDVVVNNAGYGQMGAVEEVSDAEARKNFDVNVFGLLNVLRGTLPVLRKNKKGHVFNISSIGGFTGNFSGFGVYCGTKFAVAGITESLNADLGPLGIKTTLVYPGYFRTDFLANGSISPANLSIADYSDAMESRDLHMQQINHNQPGDPEKAAKVMMEVAEMKEAPLHLMLGSDALEFSGKKIQEVIAETRKWKDLSVSTNF